MKITELLIGTMMTSPVAFIVAGVSFRAFDVPVGLALLVGLASSCAAGYLLIRELKSKPAPRRS